MAAGGFAQARSNGEFRSSICSISCCKQTAGRVAEWLKAPDSKSGVGATLPWVRIPPLPPLWVACGATLRAQSSTVLPRIAARRLCDPRKFRPFFLAISPTQATARTDGCIPDRFRPQQERAMAACHRASPRCGTWRLARFSWGMGGARPLLKTAAKAGAIDRFARAGASHRFSRDWRAAATILHGPVKFLAERIPACDILLAFARGCPGAT